MPKTDPTGGLVAEVVDGFAVIQAQCGLGIGYRSEPWSTSKVGAID